MKKGFTLIELLGVIIILALLVILVFPSIVNSVKNSSEKTDDLTLELIYNATDLYISNHKNDFSKKNGYKYIIDLSDLVDEGFLASPIKLSDSDVDITNNKCIQITYNDGYKYELKDIGTCEEILTCKPVTGDDLNYKYVYYDGEYLLGETTYTTGTKSVGDAYRCQVNETDSYIFNIIGQDASGNYNLLLNHNLGYAADGNPDTVISTLFSLTSTWTNIPVRTDSYIAEYGEYIGENLSTSQYTLNYIGQYARLIEYSELIKLNPGNVWSDSSKPWVSSVPKSTQTASFENSWQYISSEYFQYKDGSWSGYGLSCGVAVCQYAMLGIRPVITVKDSEIASK